MRVLTMSSGWTTKVATVPALRPARDSMTAGERPAWLRSGIKYRWDYSFCHIV